jgi:putative lipoic acid-binding regulatory protein
MSDSLLEFPCSFPIKIMGLDEQEFRDFAVQLVTRHVGDVQDEAVSTSKSSNGKYLSVTVTIEAQSQQQLDSIYRDLTAHERVKVVL